MSDADLIVVGGGPVGLACAIEARLSGMDVLVVEPRPGPIDKACGEGLMPGALTALHRLGVDPPGHPLAGIAYVDSTTRVEHRFSGGPGRGVRRTALHAALLERATTLGARFLHARVSAIQHEPDGVALTVGAASSAEASLHAPWVIAADGLHSPLRRMLELDGRPQRGGLRRFGVRRHYTVAPWTDLVEVYWSAGAEAYVTPVDDTTVGVAVLGRRPLDLEAALAGIPDLAARLAGAPVASGVRGAGPLLQRSRARTAGRALLAGDASGYVDALTGEGLRVGFAQAQAAVAAIRDSSPRQYERAWRDATREFRVLTTGLVVAARSGFRPRIVPTAASRPNVFGAIIERLSH